MDCTTYLLPYIWVNMLNWMFYFGPEPTIVTNGYSGYPSSAR